MICIGHSTVLNDFCRQRESWQPLDRFTKHIVGKSATQIVVNCWLAGGFFYENVSGFLRGVACWLLHFRATWTVYLRERSDIKSDLLSHPRHNDSGLTSTTHRSCITRLLAGDRFVGLVVKASASMAEDPRFESRLWRDFAGSSRTSDLKKWDSSGYPARHLVL